MIPLINPLNTYTIVLVPINNKKMQTLLKKKRIFIEVKRQNDQKMSNFNKVSAITSTNLPNSKPIPKRLVSINMHHN